MQAAKTIGILLFLSGLLGIALTIFDQVLRTGAPSHYYALIAFVIVDLVLGGLTLYKLSNRMVMLAASWSIMRITIQVCDVILGPMSQFTYAQFIDYLFNPTSLIPASLGNPNGIPAIPVDLILIIDIAILIIAWKARADK